MRCIVIDAPQLPSRCLGNRPMCAGSHSFHFAETLHE